MPIFTDFTPNMGRREIAKTALDFWKPLFQTSTKAITRLTEEIGNEYDGKVTLFDSGRTALLKILQALPNDQRDEVIVQAYTCVVVVNAIKAAGYRPVYIDIDGVNMSIEELKKKIGPSTKAVIVQHTFGFPDKIDEIKEICEENSVFLIEDLAHSLTGSFKGKKLGSFGDAAFLSFGSGKLVSCSRGGAAITKDMEITNDQLQPTQNTWKHYLKIFAFGTCKPLYFCFNIGKLKLFALSKLGFLPKVITEQEKKGKAPHPRKLANPLAEIAIIQWDKKEKIRVHRQDIAKIYDKELKGIDKLPFSKDSSYMRYPIFVDKPEKLFKFMKKNHIILGSEWSGAVIVPRSIDLSATRYKGGFPRAEEVAKRVICLPTDIHITESKAKLIAKKIKEFYGS